MRYIVGVIYNNDHEYKMQNVEAVAVFNSITKEGEIISANRVINQLKNNEKIVGASLFNRYVFKEKNSDYYILDELKLNKTTYDYRRLPVLNGKGEIIKSGVKTIIGKVNNDEYMVVDAQFNTQVVKEAELNNKCYNGMTIKNLVSLDSRVEVQR